MSEDYKGVLVENLKKLISERGINQTEFAKLMNYPETTVSNWFLKNTYPRPDKIQEMANFFGVRRIDLTEKGKDDIQINVKNVPYITDPVAAGIPDTIEGYSELPTIPIANEFLGKYANRKDLIIMRVNGESMNRIIPNGSYIGLITNIKIENLKDGDLVVFSQEYNYSLKHYYDLGNEILFKPNSTNLSFREIRCKKDERLKIVGKVIMSSLKYE